MSSLLQRLGAFSTRRRRLVVTLWLTVLVALGVGTSMADSKFSSSFTIPGSPSQDAIDLLGERLPAANGASGRIVFAADEGKALTAAQRTAIHATLAEVAKGDEVAVASDPFETKTVSQDGRIAYSEVTFKSEAGDLTNADREAVDEAGAAARDAGVQVELSGEAAPLAEESHSAEALGIVVALFVLAITFGSLLAAGMPLVAAAVGVGTGLLGVRLISAFVELSSSVTALASMLGLAVGIDYALFLISRHRKQVQTGMALEPSIAHAVGTAGSAVVFAGATVVIALCALAVTGVPFLTAMGLSAAATVAIAVLVNLTLVPALLGFAGHRAVKGKADLADRSAGGKDTLGGRWVRLVLRHRPVALLVAVLVPLALAIPALDMRLGLPDDSTAPSASTKREAYDLLKTGFGPGFSGPLTVVADLPKGSGSQQLADAVRERVAGLDDIATVSPVALSPDKTLGLFQVVPASGPSTPATEELVRAIRDQDAVFERQSGTRVLVTGQTAVNIDVSERMSGSLIPYLAVVVGLALLLLMIAFRSILVPLTAIAGFLMTIGASLGALVAVFQKGFLADLFGVASTGAPLISLIPILMIGILFGLAMDYQVFLVSGMKEEHAHGAGPQDAVVNGFRHSARVVTAAGLIMVSVFAGFIIPDDEIIKSIGFALAFGILVDAFIVRMTLIPALMSLLGERAWWLPRPLGRIVPDVDIEGAKLSAPTRSAAPAASGA
jgi:RND superfamily putative drug exporter